MNTVIQWIDIKERKPCSSGWYMTVCMPVNRFVNPRGEVRITKRYTCLNCGHNFDFI